MTHFSSPYAFPLIIPLLVLTYAGNIAAQSSFPFQGVTSTNLPANNGGRVVAAPSGGVTLACPTSSEVFFNEFHYDNGLADQGEFIEVAVLNSANVILSDITVWLYNGSDGNSYGSRALSALTVGANDGTYTYYSWNLPVNGLQNGSPDGFALSCAGTAFEFLSYEGIFAAVSGPALGQTSVDVGQVQGSNTPIGSSVQKTGSSWYATCGQNTNGTTNVRPAISIAAADAVKPEGNSGTTAFTFTVTRSGLTTGATTVNFEVTASGSNPVDMNDFSGATLPMGSITFAAGSTAETITVLVASDTDVEPDETFTITLTDATDCNTQLLIAAVEGTVQDEDGTGGCPTALTVSGPIADGIYKADQEIVSDGAVPEGGNVSFRAGNNITLQPNFTVAAGAIFEALIEVCTPGFADENGEK
jgi:hypothetical protein